MTNKKSFVLYTDIYDSIQDLPLEEKGNLLDAIFSYAKDRKTSELSPVTKMAFSFIKKTMDRDFSKWQNIVERNTKNIKKRWSKSDTKNTTGKIGIPKPLDSVSVSVSESDNNKTIYNKKLKKEQVINKKNRFIKGKRLKGNKNGWGFRSSRTYTPKPEQQTYKRKEGTYAEDII